MYYPDYVGKMSSPLKWIKVLSSIPLKTAGESSGDTHHITDVRHMDSHNADAQ